MKILHLISSGGMYGAEAVILQLSQALNASGQQRSAVGVFAHGGLPVPALHEAAVGSGISSALIACRGQLDRTVGPALRAMIREAAIDVVHAHGYKADIYAAFALLGRTRPVLVSTCHNWIDSDPMVRTYGALDRFVLRSFDEVVSVSRAVTARLLESGVAQDRVHQISNGVNLPPASSLEAGRSAQAGLRIGLVGRLSREKGVDLFLHAAARLAQHDPRLVFVVAGDGPERDQLLDLRDALALRDRVQFLGRQEDMASFYRSLDVLVSSSRTEGLPMTLLEGMSWGLPVVATSVGEVPSVVQQGVTGLLVPPETPIALAAAIDDVLQNSARRMQLGEAGRLRVTNLYSAERMAQEYLAVYRRALRRHQASTVPVRADPRTAQ